MAAILTPDGEMHDIPKDTGVYGPFPTGSQIVDGGGISQYWEHEEGSGKCSAWSSVA